MATTYTKTSTYARIELIKWQFSVALLRTTNITSQRIEQLTMGLDNKWIEKIHIYGIDSHGLCRAQLTVEIDWNEYDIQLSNGRATVSIDERWVDNTAIELKQAIRVFNNFVEKHALNTAWQITYTDHVYNNPDLKAEARRMLGLKSAEPVKWAGSSQGLEMEIPELREIKVGCRLAL